ncbi:MAG TPA: MauE/DoxX family redox-associated membrane protein [Streptosporangiaceae bacterium]|nr:MauE/DoxX family redox-associated membrane protein [Streptosporangiaceae bacterium]
MDDFGVAVLSLAACVFGASAAAKLRSGKTYRLFRDGLLATRLLPRRLLAPAAAVLAGAEALVAAGLSATAVLIAASVPGAASLAEFALAVTALLSSLLTAGVAVVIRRGTQATCACFGPGRGRQLGRAHLVRNLSLLAVICAGMAGIALAHGRPAVAGAVLGAIAGAVAALLFIRWDDLAELFAPSMGAAQTAGGAGRRHS